VFNQYLAYRFIRLIVKLFPLVVSSFDSIDSIDFPKNEKEPSTLAKEEIFRENHIFRPLAKVKTKRAAKESTTRSALSAYITLARKSSREEALTKKKKKKKTISISALSLSL